LKLSAIIQEQGHLVSKSSHLKCKLIFFQTCGTDF
jgi:hypothetical protein